MNRKIVLLTLALMIILLVSVFAVFENSVPKSEASSSPFYVGIEFGYGNASDCNALVDKVKNYTNLLVISSTNVTQSEALLNATCDYAYDAGLHLIVFFPQSDPIYSSSGGGSYHPYLWGMKAKDKYGSYFLGSYVYDEPGGEVLDRATGAVNINYVSNYGPVLASPTAVDYTSAARNFAANARKQMDAYLYCARKAGTSVITADYGLYWFDYKAGYDAVLAEFGWGNDRQMVIALCRGAATAQNKDWGAIICWETRTNNTAQIGHMESGPALYNDLTLAYDNGAKYAVVFDYAGSNQPNPYPYGILAEEHFDALNAFWNYVQQHPEKQGATKADTALVLPQGYGFGFRMANDKIWGFDQADKWTDKIWVDVNNLLNQYNSSLDIVYSDPEFQSAITSSYSKVLPWTSGATIEDYPVLDLNSTFGFSSIQKAINSGATASGDTLFVKAGIYQENLIINKAISLVGENKETTIIDGGNKASALYIYGTGVNVTGFTIRNGNAPELGQLTELNSTAALLQLLQNYGFDVSQLQGLSGSAIDALLSQITQVYGVNPPTSVCAGIYLSNANNCTITGNSLTNNTYGILMTSSANNTLKNNALVDNKYGLGVSATASEQYLNDIDNSNSVNGKPIYYWTNENGLTVPSDAGYVALVNCTNITASNLHLANNYNGLLIVTTKNSTITDNTLTNNYEGLRVSNSSNNILQNNNINNNQYNLYVDYSQPNSIDPSNKLNGNPIYIWIDEHDKTVPTDAGYVALINCSRITVQDLNLTNNEIGIFLLNSQNSTIAKNTLSNLNCAIQLSSASDNLIIQNTITASQDGIKIEDASANNNIINNSINASWDSGIIIQSSNNNNLQENKLTDNSHGVVVIDSSANTLKGNSLATNNYGIQFTSVQPYYSFPAGSTCTGNRIIENDFIENQNGIAIAPNAAGNTFYHNNFINNTKQATTQSYSSSMTNSWDNGVQGNYWSNYNGTDTNKDGIGDQPMDVFQQYQQYTVDGVPQTIPVASDLDRFPLIHPFSPS